MSQLLKIVGFSLILNSFCHASKFPASTLQSLLDNFRAKSQAPASVMSIKLADGSIHTFVSGTVSKITPTNPNPAKVTINHLFQIGSITKLFTAAIILQLEAEGKLSINDTITETTKRFGKWLPEKYYLAWKDITIKQLLNMTSGIFDVCEDNDFNQTLVKYPNQNWSSLEILEVAYQHKSYFAPGKGWHYTNTSYNVLGMIIEAATGHSVEMEIQRRLLAANKLNLTNTYYLPYQYSSYIMKRMAHGYDDKGRDMTSLNMSVAGASGAMIANSIDIVKWIAALFSGKVLPETQLKEMLNPVCAATNGSCKLGEPLLPNSQLQGFGLGLAYIYDKQLALYGVISVRLQAIIVLLCGYLMLTLDLL